VNEKDELILKLGRNRRLAHQTLFRHRHPDPTPEFHFELIDIWHSRIPKILTMAFREAAKSTIAEEAIILGADYKLFHNAVIVGNTEKRATERLRAIKYELDTNELNESLFGPLGASTATVWNDAEVILANGVRIFAVGRGQSLRGTKHLHYRPDFCFCDDIEEVEKGQVYSDEDAEETIRWFMKVLVPALDKDARIRVNATPLSNESLPIRLSKDKDWVTKIYPIEYKNPAGERQPTWQARYPLPWIDAKKNSFERLGLHHDYMQEYMCQTEDASRRIFTADMFTVRPMVRTWQPTFAMYDPARTVKATSATTGWAIWSWIGNRLVVWDGGGDFWKPDELISHLFSVDEEYSPVMIGVEEDGLHEFVMQPLRHEQTRRGYLIPVVPQKAPKGKLSFIEGLQPFFVAKEITFAKELSILRAQFLGFPTGRIDGPNALAYALRMRPGQIIYDGFSHANVVESLPVRRREPVWLCVNATASLTTGVLCQVVDGALHVLGDWVREGDPGASLAGIVVAANLQVPQGVRLVCGPDHFREFDSVGLRGACAKIPVGVQGGTAPNVGRDELRALFQKSIRGEPAVRCSAGARWTLNALAAGYAREVSKRGILNEEAREGVYKVLMEGLESFVGLFAGGINAGTEKLNWQVTETGQKYLSALPGKHGHVDTKSDWGVVTDRMVGR
jgi:hypothetical protein